MDFASRFSLRTSLLLLLALVAALAGTKQLVTALGDRARTAEAAQSQLLERAIRSAEREELIFADVEFVLRQFARHPASDATSLAACTAELTETVAELPWLTSISLIATDGRMVCSSLTDVVPTTSIADRDYFQTALRTLDFVVSDFLVSRVTGLPVVIAAMPRVVDGTAQSVVIAGIELSELGLAVADAHDGAEGTMTALLDRHAVVVATSPPEGPFALGRDLAASALWASTDGRSGVVPEVVFDNRTYIVSFSSLPAMNGRLLVLRDRANVLADANARAIRSVAAMLLATVVVCLIVWLGGERLVLRPLAAMRSAAGRIASGDLARIDTTGFVPEFRQLGERFNSMSEALAARTAELNAANLRLAELAMRDGLTDLGNRRAFEDRIEQEGERCARGRKVLSLLLIDIDRFKQFNDQYGHFEGDVALRRVAALVGAAARRASDFAARIGGEEFALILPDCPQAEALQIARRLVAEVAALRMVHVGSEEGVVTISVGVAGQRMMQGVSVRTLLESADVSLYAAKRQGRNSAVGTPEVVSLVS